MEFVFVLIRTPRFFFFSASVSGVGKRKEVLEKRRGEELLPKKEDNFQVDDTTGVGKSQGC